MKALSLWQPWASLMAIGVKCNETRPRPLAFTGDLAIHAAKLRWKNDVPEYAFTALKHLWAFRGKFHGYHSNVKDLYDSLPFGQIVCVVEKFGCTSTNDDNGDDRSLTPLELDLGDYSPDRFYYPTRNCRQLNPPVNISGRQGIFELSAAVEFAVRERMAAQSAMT